MLRAFFVRLSENRSIRNFAERSAIGRRVSGRFVAGTKIEDAVRVTQAVNRAGMSVSIDNLGENVTNPDEARESAEALPADSGCDRSQPPQCQHQPEADPYGSGRRRKPGTRYREQPGVEGDGDDSPVSCASIWKVPLTHNARSISCTSSTACRDTPTVSAP